MEGPDDSAKDHGPQGQITNRFGHEAVDLQDVTADIAELANRIGALEELQKNVQSDKDLDQGKEARTGVAQPLEGQPDPTPAEVMGQPSDMGGKFGKYVQFREEISNGGKLEWNPVQPSDATSSTPGHAFRYDINVSGDLVLSVFRGKSRLYDDLRKLCNPAYHGQVNEREGRLEIADLNPLLHARDQLEELKLKGSLDSEKRDELEVLLQLYKEQEGWPSHLWHAMDQYDKMLKTAKLDWKSLKGLFHIGQLVVFRELRDEWAVARVTMVSSNEHYEYSMGLEMAELQLNCEAIEFDGKTCRTHVYRKIIPHFAGTKEITELPVYPLKNCPEERKKKIKDDSIKSGNEWRELVAELSENGSPRAAVRQYEGYCETFGQDANDEINGGRGSALAGRVIVDPARFPDRLLHFAEDNSDPFKAERPMTRLDEQANKKLLDEKLLLCPEKVLVHSLSDNEWYYVAMSRLEKPKWDDMAWKRLVMPNSNVNPQVAKSFNRIKVLAKAHQGLQRKDKTKEIMNNFKGKGKGLTFLLHGSPGVGKTMLAECLSEVQKRPLYRINLGKLVADDQWESKIDEIFRQAHSWDAILLVDEAEVVLAERTQENMHQSAWVAVFLRKTEYFEGILLLTTNLIHMIDPAFISRVNLGIKVPDLDQETRLQIWTRVLEEDINGVRREIDKKLLEPIKRWAEKDLNGRQIRNVVLSARLAAFKGELPIQVLANHIQEALEDVLKFKDMIAEEKQTMEQTYLSQWS
ncbi:hypothetical protein Daus18300_013720 [Diaporthe australafricana]|uniref:AAA+ ATPase domain-containing protein n=1 Tax=Diaporthe australafricana TaxID=127596 RepID=A0ABR3VXY7_9PEZI